MSAKKQLFLHPAVSTVKGSWEGRVSTLYQIKKDGLFLELMQVVCTQVADWDASIPRTF